MPVRLLAGAARYCTWNEAANGDTDDCLTGDEDDDSDDDDSVCDFESAPTNPYSLPGGPSQATPEQWANYHAWFNLPAERMSAESYPDTMSDEHESLLLPQTRHAGTWSAVVSLGGSPDGDSGVHTTPEPQTPAGCQLAQW